MKPRVLVSDIDGTLLLQGEPTDGLKELSRLLARYRSGVRLIYATGRTFTSTWDRIERGILPVPDAIASLVGTEVWFPPWNNPSQGHALYIKNGWDRSAVEDIAHVFRTILEPQEDMFQSPFKASYILHDPAAIRIIQECLTSHSIQAQVIFSCNRYLDFLPLRAGKNRAADYCCHRWKIPTGRVLACGDSENDSDMLTDPQKLAVVVGNAENTLRRMRENSTFHIADAPFAMGVLEGADSFQFWSN